MVLRYYEVIQCYFEKVCYKLDQKECQRNRDEVEKVIFLNVSEEELGLKGFG